MKKIVSVTELKEGDILQSDIKAGGDQTLIARGTVLTTAHISRLRHWCEKSNCMFNIEIEDQEGATNNLNELQKNTINRLKNVYHSFGDDLESSLSELVPFLPHICDDLKMIEDLPSDAIKIQYADNRSNHYFRVARMSIALASIYNKNVIPSKQIPLESICLASLLYDYGKRFKNDSKGLAELDTSRNAIRGLKLNKKLFDGTYNSSLSTVYAYLAFKDKVPENVRSTILYCNPDNLAIKPPVVSNSAEEKAANIISICSAYDALLEHVVKNDFQTPFENVLSYMDQLSFNNSLDSDLYRLFLKHIPIYPTGIKVLLSSGEKAIVVDRSGSFPTKPKVLLLPPNKPELIDLSETLNLTIRRVVQDNDLSIDTVDSIQHEQFKDVEVPSDSTQDKFSGTTSNSIVLQNGDTNKQQDLTKQIRDSFDR